MRLKNTVNNAAANVALLLLRTMLMFVSRLVFVRTLGKTYLGVNGLMTNVLSMLSLAELGISTAINFSLYQPLAESDMEKVSVLMGFYRQAYQVIGAVVAGCGLLFLPFLDHLVKGGEDIKHLRLIFLLYLFNSVSSYYITYKETLINAAQKNYKIAPINGIFTSLMILMQMVFMILFQNYFIYLIIQIAMGFFQRLAVNCYITKGFPQVDFHCRQKLPEKEKNVLIRNVKGMLFHKLGEYSIYGTDNLVISAFINITMTGIYSNYSMVISMINSILGVIFNSATASFGDLFVGRNREKQYEMYLRFEFLGYGIYGWCGICLLGLLTPFIRLFFGAGYELGTVTVLLLSLNFYMTGMRTPLNILKQAAGIYYEDRFVPLAQGAVNIALSVPLAVAIGIDGVFIGTVVSGLIPQLIKPLIFYRKCFPDHPASGYFLRHSRYLAKLMAALIPALWLADVWSVGEGLAEVGIRILVCSTVSAAVLYGLNRKSPECLYYMDLVKGLVRKVGKRWNNL